MAVRIVFPVFYLFLMMLLPVHMAKAGESEPADQITFGRSVLSVHTRGGSHKFSVEIAETYDQHARGLMFRKNMPMTHGMLFLFEQDQMITMWMKNTFIPLDIIFIDRSGVIVNIVRSTEPYSLDHIKSAKPVISVLEVNAQVTRRLNIQAGDRIEYPFFTP